MGHTFSNLLVHVVFSTKDRKPLITEAIQQRLYEYMAGIARQEFGTALIIGGVADHLHGLLLLRTDASVAHAMNRWKSLSSKWINETFELGHRFAWQTGYGAFSVSESSKPAVMKYVRDQKEHHRRLTFKEEFEALLRKHEIDYDPTVIWQ